MKINDFYKSFFIVSISTFIVRIIIYAQYIVLNHTPKITQVVSGKIWTFHHYYLGLFFWVIGYIGRKNPTWRIIAFAGVGIIVEEWTVLLENLGVNHSIRYFSAVDIPLGMVVFILIYGTFRLLKK